MARYFGRLSKDTVSETFRIHLKIISVAFKAPEDLYGVYLKFKRGKNRMIGYNRYAIYKDSKSVDINEAFEQVSVFFKNLHTGKYQSKVISIKLKQENVSYKKDKVLAKAIFDASLFVGRKSMISEIQFTSAGG